MGKGNRSTYSSFSPDLGCLRRISMEDGDEAFISFQVRSDTEEWLFSLGAKIFTKAERAEERSCCRAPKNLFCEWVPWGSGNSGSNGNQERYGNNTASVSGWLT